MSATERASEILLFIAFPATNLFVISYFLFADWKVRITGWAVMISKFGLALLVDAAFLFRVRGNVDYPFHDQLLLVSFGFIVVGTYLYLISLFIQRFRRRTDNLSRNDDTPQRDTLLDGPPSQR